MYIITRGQHKAANFWLMITPMFCIPHPHPHPTPPPPHPHPPHPPTPQVYTCGNLNSASSSGNDVKMRQIDHTDLLLTHWGRVTHICVGKLIIIGWDNGLSPDRRQAIISPNAGLLSIGPLRTYFSENLIKIQQFSLKKMHMKMSSAKWRSSCLGLNELIGP